MQVATNLPAGSSAIPLVEIQGNMSEFIRCVLEDFAEANGTSKGYALIPKKDRLKEYFRHL